MKKALSAAAIAAMFVLSGCGAAEESAAPVATPSPTPTPVALTVDETCELLVGENWDGPFVEGAGLILNVGDPGTDWQAIPRLSEELTEIAVQAPESMKPSVEAFLFPFDDMIASAGSTWELDEDPYNAAKNEIAESCDAQLPGGSVAEATEKPEPAFEITGDKAADIEATGFEVKTTPEEFLSTMAIALCRDYELMKNGKESFGEIVKTMVDAATEGDGALMVRTVIAYECPERAEEVEKHLD